MTPNSSHRHDALTQLLGWRRTRVEPEDLGRLGVDAINFVAYRDGEFANEQLDELRVHPPCTAHSQVDKFVLGAAGANLQTRGALRRRDSSNDPSERPGRAVQLLVAQIRDDVVERMGIPQPRPAAGGLKIRDPLPKRDFPVQPFWPNAPWTFTSRALCSPLSSSSS